MKCSNSFVLSNFQMWAILLTIKKENINFPICNIDLLRRIKHHQCRSKSNLLTDYRQRQNVGVYYESGTKTLQGKPPNYINSAKLNHASSNIYIIYFSRLKQIPYWIPV